MDGRQIQLFQIISHELQRPGLNRPQKEWNNQQPHREDQSVPWYVTCMLKGYQASYCKYVNFRKAFSFDETCRQVYATECSFQLPHLHMDSTTASTSLPQASSPPVAALASWSGAKTELGMTWMPLGCRWISYPSPSRLGMAMAMAGWPSMFTKGMMGMEIPPWSFGTAMAMAVLEPSGFSTGMATAPGGLSKPNALARCLQNLQHHSKKRTVPRKTYCLRLF